MEAEFVGVDLLGKLYIEEMFLFYDEPQLFTCISKFGQRFMVLYVDYTEQDQTWLFAPLTEARLAFAKSNRISLYDVFTKPEDEFIWKVIKENNSNIAKATQIDPMGISSDLLPTEDAYLNWKNDEMMPCINEKIFEMAQSERRDIVNLSLEIANGHVREIDCVSLGEVLSNTQNILYMLAHRGNSARGKIPSNIKVENSLQVTGTYAASFGIQLKSNELSDLLGETRLSDTLKLFAQLLMTKSDPVELKAFLITQNQRVVLKYRNLMKTLIEADTGIKVEIASPNKNYFDVKLSVQDVKNTLSILDGEINNMVTVEKIFGEIVGIHTEKKTFSFRSVDGEHITGKLADHFNETTFEVPKHMEIVVEQKIQLNNLTKREKYIYTLIKVNDTTEELTNEDVE
ncbi:DUF6575 domain-containing protein [Paenibacillus crassostreae]|uniref:DUF6575 domain-containing protein n=1 Tax=Paenibacillus crassostreae TaxID=1763538 RepID=A0A167AUP4_9BACL|nr:DUF6575 domain-containing protein [Paenibacillus crassostreae]AOZ93624.1 hypothetical protein LPB68_16445 [Paenibacillus crassostreae]OAB71451.1 hypothetical protein PNBC_19315 [Paenibacillus crassostreae]